MTKQMTEHELTLLIKQLDLSELDVDFIDKPIYGKKENIDGLPRKQDGWIQVKDRRIIIQDPVDGGKLPVISSIAPVKLKINDTEIVSESTITSADRISWEIEEKPLFEIIVSNDKLHAYFHLRSKERFGWKLMNTEPVSKIIIMAEEDRNIVLETVHLTDVASILEQKSIKSNLDLASIQQELISPTYKPIVVAKGKAAVPGKDAQLEIYFSQQVESQFFEVGGSVDFRNHMQIPSVKKGEIIAKKIPLVEGVPGYDVYGDVIIPPAPKDIFIVAKSNVELTADGEIIALKEGRPRITGSRIKTFDISTAFIVSGNVDIETGNIVFSGDVIVYGNVTDHMIIESLGNVYVYGNIYNATVTATGSIHVRGNVIGSKLYSGYFGVMFNRLYNTSKTLSELFEKLLLASKVLVQALELRKQTIRFGQIVLLLMENKFKEIPTTIRELLSVIANIQHLKNEEYQKLKEMSEVFFQPTKLLETATDSLIQSFLVLLRDTHQEVARMQEEKVQIYINQCHNSELKSNGDILIQREGVLLSDLYSAKNIIFNHESAVCRGSKLEAGDSISAKTIDGQTGANTVLKANRKVSVKKMLSGRVCIGRFCMDIYEAIENKTFDIRNIKQRD
ncbi:FapA family protein [Aneurinibacillus terranovensis]|uniref:FapA family protein n=1 Tax=Aneurinibacillus terranovensis TaxID=278991 RepID=UPI0004150E36|nr:FapA family protein [Aneurinibacillus terranovensis]